MTKSTKTWILEKNNKLKLVDAKIDTDKYIVVKTILSSICGTDLHLLDNHDSLDRPLSLGHEFIGEVISVPKNNKKYSVGDKLIIAPGISCGNCHYCDKFSNPNWCTNRKSHGISSLENDEPILGGFSLNVALMNGIKTYKIPSNLSMEKAVLAEPLTVAIRALDRGTNNLRSNRDKTIAIVGLGPIGTLTALIAKLNGYRVVGYDLNEYRLNYVIREFGIETKHINNIEKNNSDVVIECTGSPNSIESCLSLVRRGGRIVIAGHFYPNGETFIDPYVICRSDIEIVGTVLGDESSYMTAINLLQLEEIKWEKVISHIYNFNELEKAFRKAQNRTCMKISIKCEEK